MNKLIINASLVPILFTFLVGCQSAVEKTLRDTKYSAYELVGIQKRDLFKKEVRAVKESQEVTGEAYKDALERLRDVYALGGGDLEKQYDKLNSSYEESQKRSADVSARIRKLEVLSQDLFVEWQKEIGEISDASLRARSTNTLQQTQKKYQEFHASLKKLEKSMGPVLRKLKDQVLFLKHNLNAKAISGLKVESTKIENDISILIKDVNASISEAEALMKTIGE